MSLGLDVDAAVRLAGPSGCCVRLHYCTLMIKIQSVAEDLFHARHLPSYPDMMVAAFSAATAGSSVGLLHGVLDGREQTSRRQLEPRKHHGGIDSA